MADVKSVDDVRDALAENDYLADEGLATAIFLALRLERPLLLEGEAGVGKTEVAKVLARWTGGELVRLQCYEGIDVSQAVYEWDYSRQLLHLRAAEASGGPVDEDELYSERFLVRRPLLARDRVGRPDTTRPPRRRGRPRRRRVRGVPARDPGGLLGVRARARDVPRRPAAGRRGDVEPHPRRARRARSGGASTTGSSTPTSSASWRSCGFVRRRCGESLAREVAAAVEALRDLELYKPPGVAETIDWAHAVAALAATRLDATTVDVTLGTVLKYREDQERARAHGLEQIVASAGAR